MKRFPLFLVAVLVLILGMHVLATFASLYYIFWWLDIVLHFAGGFWVASALFYLMRRSFLSRHITAPPFVLFLGIIAGTITVGVFWEFFEFGVDIFVTPFLGVGLEGRALLADTLSDLFFDMAGGALAGALFVWRKVWRKKFAL